jgi:hypothetical protein
VAPLSESDFRSTGRFDVRRRLGEGGMGVVYEAWDRERRARVAIKTLRTLSAEGILRFKNEFRALQDLSHPNLCTLGELICDAGQWFFTMELVDGVDLLSWVRPAREHWSDQSVSEPRMDPIPSVDTMRRQSSTLPAAPPPSGRLSRPTLPLDVARLRTALLSLGHGVTALHAAGVVHRDIKPSNILVEPNGRAVLLDFGLATSAARPDQSDVRVVGTADYMAPEQASAKKVGPEADWYSVGVILYEALTGGVPFSGAPLEVLLQKQAHEPPPPRSLAPEVPAELDALCTGLLRKDPRQRFGARELYERLARGDGTAPDLRQRARERPFVGRRDELAALEAAFERVRAGAATTLHVCGESGVGKSALVRHFVRRLRAAVPEAVVLHGRCYERESVPYKAVDGVVDALARWLSKLPKRESAALLPQRAGLLAEVFPVLRRVEAMAQAPRPSHDVDPQQLRQRLFGSLRELLTQLGQTRPLVLVVDDLQWADADSLALLEAVTRAPDAPPMLLLATVRAEDATGSSGPMARVGLGEGALADGARSDRASAVAAGAADEGARNDRAAGAGAFVDGVRGADGTAIQGSRANDAAVASLHSDSSRGDLSRSDIAYTTVAPTPRSLSPVVHAARAQTVRGLGAVAPAAAAAVVAAETAAAAVDSAAALATHAAKATTSAAAASPGTMAAAPASRASTAGGGVRAASTVESAAHSSSVGHTSSTSAQPAVGRHTSTALVVETATERTSTATDGWAVRPATTSGARTAAGSPTSTAATAVAPAGATADHGSPSTTGMTAAPSSTAEPVARSSALSASAPHASTSAPHASASAPHASASASHDAAELRPSPLGSATQMILLARLPPDEARQLAAVLLAEQGASSTTASTAGAAIADEAGGHPLFIDELVRHAAASGPEREGPLHLDEALRERVRRLPADAQHVLELVSVAGGPLAQHAAARAADLGFEEFAQQAATLRAANLVRSSGPRPSDLIEPYHDRVRAAVQAGRSPSELRRAHERVALGLESTGRADPEALAAHWQGAGDNDKAAGYAAQAAERASKALAFERAAQLYRQTLLLRPPGSPDVYLLQIRLGDALARTGRGSEAARAYLAAAGEAAPAEALELRRQASEQLLRSGFVDDGLAALQPVLAAVKLSVPATARRAWTVLAWRRARLSLRGLGFERRRAVELPPAQLARVDTAWSLAVGLANIDPVRGAGFGALHLRLALDLGEPSRVARALAFAACVDAMQGVAHTKRIEALVAHARRLAEELGDAHAEALALAAGAILAHSQGRWRGCLPAVDAVERLLRERCSGVAWELSTTNLMRAVSLARMGELSELAKNVTASLQEAEQRGDRYAATALRMGEPNIIWLVQDLPHEARGECEDAIGHWSRSGFHAQHVFHAFAMGQIELYAGAGAWERAQALWPQVERSFLLRLPLLRAGLVELRGRAALAAAASATAARRKELLREARAAARRLERETISYAAASSAALRAAAAHLDGDDDTAQVLLARAALAFDEADMAMHAAVARGRRGHLVGGDEGRALTVTMDAWMRRQNVSNPDRFARMILPGF